ncbi:MAG: preprotein translocase subunit SecE [Chthoniobacterales bacterium]|nr:preprotein translocase subunit SecE [Chthoniobacterales bacterium]
MFAKTKKFLQEVRAELSKAQWPWNPSEKGFKRYKELWDSTLVVVIAMLIVGGYIAFFDLVTINVVGFLTRP